MPDTISVTKRHANGINNSNIEVFSKHNPESGYREITRHGRPRFGRTNV
jgi:hypothetical protein